MTLLDRYFAASEERHALAEEDFKDCGAFRLGSFDWPAGPAHAGVDDFVAAVQRVVASADDFYAVRARNRDFKLDGRSLTYSSAHPDGTANDTVCVHVVERRRAADKAVIIIPHWNALQDHYLALATALARFGFDAFILTLPHHVPRSSSSHTQVANAFLNADLGAAIRSVRQAVVDARTLTGWLKDSGYADVHLVGASLGSCVASLTAAFDPRISRCALLLTAGDFADTVWTGRATAHIRRTIEDHISIEQLRQAWAVISPLNFVTRFAASGTPLLMVSGRRDAVVRFGLASDYAGALKTAGADLRWRVLPCGHYTLGAFPFSIMMVAELLRFLRR
ncbi:MAG: alpha/beta hydrolase family protein [Hyphomicrobiales bacterium]